MLYVNGLAVTSLTLRYPAVQVPSLCGILRVLSVETNYGAQTISYSGDIDFSCKECHCYLAAQERWDWYQQVKNKFPFELMDHYKAHVMCQWINGKGVDVQWRLELSDTSVMLDDRCAVAGLQGGVPQILTEVGKALFPLPIVCTKHNTVFERLG